MPGEMCNGDAQSVGGPKILRESRAYCEGRASQLDGGLIGDNPYTAMGAAMINEKDAWDRGFANAVNAIPARCCAR